MVGLHAHTLMEEPKLKLVTMVHVQSIVWDLGVLMVLARKRADQVRKQGLIQ